MADRLQQFQNDYLTTELHESVVVLKFQGDFFRALTDLNQMNLVSQFFKCVSEDSNLKALIIHPFFLNAGVDEYQEFFGVCGWQQTDALHRFYNVLDQTMVSLIELDKLVIQTCQGDVLSILMNIGLACDYRIVAHDTVFHHAFSRRGMLPKGGSPFFLSRLLGGGKALELLLLERSIKAADALSHGLVDRVVSRENIEQEALEVAQQFAEIPLQTLRGVKRLVNFSSKEIRDYLAFESREIGQIIRCNQIANL